MIAKFLCFACAAAFIAATFVSPASIARAAEDPVASDFVSGQLLIGYRKSKDVDALLNVEGVLGVVWNSNLQKLGTTILSVTPGEELILADQLSSHPGVRFAEPNYVVEPALAPSDTLWPQQYGPNHVGAPAAWDITTGFSSVTVAIIDSGIDTKHPEFAGRITQGYDFVDRDSIPNDECGHGTHVSGIAAATGNNGQGVAGMAWGVKIMPLRVLGGPGDPYGPCGGTTASVADALVYAANKDVDIVNMSLGTSAPSSLMQNATYYAYLHGVALFAAAGNAGTSPVFYPAAYPWVMAIGASDPTGARASYSNTGSALDIIAPGTDILSTTPRGYFYWSDHIYNLDHNYDYLSGTSMASPFVAGGAALLASQSGFDYPDAIYEALTATALDLDTAGRDDRTGYGLMQIDSALGYTPTVGPPSSPILPATIYDILDTRTCANLITYSWRDATQGSPLPVFGNNGEFTNTLPFTFNFGEVDYSQVTVSANGYLTFGGDGTEHENFLIPGISEPNNFIAPFWDDLNPSAGGLIYAWTRGSAPDREYIVEWRNVPLYLPSGGSSPLDFEVILHETSNLVTFQYKTLSGRGATGSSATIGLEFADGQTGTEYSYNQKNAINVGQAIQFVPYVAGQALSDGCIPPDQPETGVGPPEQPETGVEDEENNKTDILKTTVGPEGGYFDIPPFYVNVPAGLAKPGSIIRISLLNSAPDAPNGWISLGEFIYIDISPQPEYANGKPTLYYSFGIQDVLQAGGHRENLFFAFYDPVSGTWQPLPTFVNGDGSMLAAVVPHLSLFGIFTMAPSSLPVTGAPISFASILEGSQVEQGLVDPFMQSMVSNEYGESLIKTIVIPILGISSNVVPVGWTATGILAEWDSPGGEVGWVLSSALPDEGGNTVLYGHNNIDAAVFRNLIDLQVGDMIHLFTGDKFYAYQVSAVDLIQVVTGEEQQAYFEYMAPSDKSMLTLISCWPYFSNTHRVIVRAKPWVLPTN